MRITRNDRRFDDRHPGTGLVARIHDLEIEVLDVSIGGIKIARPSGLVAFPSAKFDFVLVSTHWPDMKPANGAGTVRALGKDWVALQFVRPSYNLMKCVSRHVAGLVWGDKPYGY